MSMSLSTLGALIDTDHMLRACCNNPKCRHYAKLDLEYLAVKLGRDHSSMRDDLVPKLKCSKCKSKNISLILSAKSTEGLGHT
ncbi:hypothetical protein CU102_27755 [Phyllobacterium brassicacearum]|uniref:Uncharacterized protein n=1 Tax=Phyllobacterium brassicacearum TaxID=314235 RepID=A0A2P7AXW0_9HYPH|nr:hypothetical protein [Phyllobacterium brassicacearum]PSH59048.1 hypothetical protein CU102_27755 [Phyllobacterium brassicacearum]TDQ09140.1 hypothetical protein DEV91_15811 [Phyllobacterium brassicacearum]